MRPRTSAWTDRHSSVAALLMLALDGALVGVTEDSPVPVWFATALTVVSVAALALDTWGGALAGLTAAVAFIFVRRLNGLWSPHVFVPALLEALTLLLVGAVGGRTGTVLRRRGDDNRPPSLLEPVYGSMGLLSRHAAMARLTEEIARADRRDGAVTLALFDVVGRDGPMSGEGRSSALRAVARIVESGAQDDDVPFALAADRLGIIFPDSTRAAVWDVVGRILESTAGATLFLGPDREPRPLSSAVTVFVGIAEQSPRRSTAATFVDEAAAALDRARHEELTS